MSHEFELIARHFAPLGAIGDPNRFLIGQGDDCAVVNPDPRPMAFSIDTQVSGRHFFADTAPEYIAARGLGAALSDLAAMGATPAFFTLALSLPDNLDDDWLARYAQTLEAIARTWSIPLIGGDTTASPLLVQSFQVHGYLDQAPMTRSGAREGDLVAVSGNLGDAAAAVSILASGKQPSSTLAQAFQQPKPQITLGKAIAPWATACIDISDGLVADLGHICENSQCGAEIQLDQLPLSQAFRDAIPLAEQMALAAAGGDDYQLCFTLPPEHLQQIAHLPVTIIGKIVQGQGVICKDRDGRTVTLAKSGYQHR